MKATARTYTGLQKQQARVLTSTPGKLYRNIALLPGPRCLGLKYYLKSGMVTANTGVTVIEWSRDRMSQIKRELARMPFKDVRFHNGPVETTPDHGPYDLINLDTESSLSMEMLRWIARQDFLPDGELNVWLTAYRHNMPFKESLISTFLNTKRGLRIVSEMRDNFTDILSRPGATELVTGAAIYSALNRYDVSVEPFFNYSEHVNFMYVYRFINLNPAEVPRINIEDILVPGEHQQVAYRPDSGERKMQECVPAKMILEAIQGTTGMRAYTTGQLRRELENGRLSGKNPMMIRAGWKARVSRLVQGELRQQAHRYIDSLKG